MDSSVQNIVPRELQELRDLEARLESQAREMETRFSGLKDIDLLLTLARVKLRLCLAFMRRGPEKMAAEIGEKASAALRIVDGLLSENISEDQAGIVQASPLFEELRKTMEEFIVAGGGGYVETRGIDERKKRILSRTVVAAIRRHMGEDDRYPPLEIESYPPLVQKVLLLLFPIFIRLRPAKPPYGIEEGEEVTYSSPNMKLPLSQAIHYIETELLPELEGRLEKNPGDARLQEEIRQVRQRAEDYTTLRFFPRSTPVLLEKGYYTEGMTGYTADGEMLVPIPLPVTFRSGTNLDRKMELVRMDVVRRIAGHGVSNSIDQEYERLRSLESGMRGSSRTASMKLDAAWGYRVLRQEFPFLARLSDKPRFLELMRVVQSGSRGSSQRRIAALMDSEPGPVLPTLSLDRE